MQQEARGVVRMEQGQRLIAVFVRGVAQQIGMDDGAALGGDLQGEYVGFDTDGGASFCVRRRDVTTGGGGRDVAASRCLRHIRPGIARGNGRRGRRSLRWRGRQVGDLPFLPQQKRQDGGTDVEK